MAIADGAAPIENELIDALRRIGARRPHVHGDDAGAHGAPRRAATASA